MLTELVRLKEHSTSSKFSDEELLSILKSDNKLVENVDFNNNCFKTNYFIGVTWLADTETALYVTPKLDEESSRIDYFLMLSKAFQHPEMLEFSDDLFAMDFNAKPVKILQNQDFITPFLVMTYLQTVYVIVKKGLKKDYYRRTSNLHGAVKGKILVSTTIKHNFTRNRTLDTYCSYDDYGTNNLENRILKKALKFSISYLKSIYSSDERISGLMSFIYPAFKDIDDEASIAELQSPNKNPFFSEYRKGLHLAKILLKRFSYNLQNTDQSEITEIQPFWINMPRLFEFYVLGLLREHLGRNEIIFQSKASYGDLDYLRITAGKEMVIDAKYKKLYRDSSYDIDDIRQLSGYARDIQTLNKTKIAGEIWRISLLPCLIIYPDIKMPDWRNIDMEITKNRIAQFQNFFKLGVQIPVIE